MLLAHKITLDPNAAQRLYFATASGTARFAWNWALAEWRRQYRAGGKPSHFSLSRAPPQALRLSPAKGRRPFLSLA
jgi:putative transposase